MPVSGHDEVANEEPTTRDTFFVELQHANLTLHLSERAAGAFRIVGSGEVTSGQVPVPEFEVGHVDIDDTIEEAERVKRIISAGVIDEGQAQSLVGREVQCFQNVGHHVGRGHEINIVASLFL